MIVARIPLDAVVGQAAACLDQALFGQSVGIEVDSGVTIDLQIDETHLHGLQRLASLVT